MRCNSTLAWRACGLRAATSIAASRSGTSTMQNPPITSLLSANGPSLTTIPPSRTRTQAAADSCASGAPRFRILRPASSCAYAPISAIPAGLGAAIPFSSTNKRANSTTFLLVLVEQEPVGSTLSPGRGRGIMREPKPVRLSGSDPGSVPSVREGALA
jgi:hypothetical protein